MASKKQRAAARKNFKKAAASARKKRAIAHLSKSTSTALGKQTAKVPAGGPDVYAHAGPFNSLRPFELAFWG